MNKNKSLFSLIGKHKKNVCFGVIGLTMVDAIMLLIPIIVGNVITQLSEMESSAISINIINKSALYLLVCGVVMAFFRFVWRYFLMGTARRIERDLREEYFLRLQRLPMKFFNNYNAGDLMARGVNDIETIKMACGFGIVVAYDGIVLLAFIFVCMFLISPEFTIYASLPFILMSFFIIKYGHAIERLFLNVQKSFSKLTEETRRIIFSIKVIKSLNDQKTQYQYSDFQKSERDFAFVIDKFFKSQDLIEIILNVDNSLIQNVRIFDVYQGENIPSDKKSVALNVTIQSLVKTLNEEDLNQITKKIISTVETKTGAKIRS